MTDDQHALVRDTWTRLAPSAERLSAMFYERLFELDPSSQRFFDTAAMPAQRWKFARMLAEIAAVEADPRTLVRVAASLGRRHAGYGVNATEYAHATVALLWALEQGLGSAWTPPVRDAWTEAVTLVSSLMRRAAVLDLSLTRSPDFGDTR
ncbi:MAG: globin [Geminicoccaceae bacterium]|jgi:nitric oxide dioxygenase|nr:globin [Geminicoccaceae bacterium]